MPGAMAMRTARTAGIDLAKVSGRVQRRVNSRVVKRQIAIVSPALVGGLSALVEVTLDRQGAEHLAAFEARAVDEAAVQQCYRVSPGPDFVLVLWVAEMAGYHALVQRLLTQDANVRNVKSFFVTHRGKFEPAVGGGWALG